MIRTEMIVPVGKPTIQNAADATAIFQIEDLLRNTQYPTHA
jgi:hypothetical protein